MCGIVKSVGSLVTGVLGSVLGTQGAPDKGAIERDAKSKAQAEVDAANTAATDATNQKLRQRNMGRAASVLSTGAGSNAPALKSTLGQ